MQLDPSQAPSDPIRFPSEDAPPAAAIESDTSHYVRFDAEKQKTLCTLIAGGWSRRRAALHVGVSPSTVRKLAQRDPAFLERLVQCEMQSELVPLRHLRAGMERSWRAAAWLLERQHPHLYGRRSSDALTRRELADCMRACMEFAVSHLENEADRERLLGAFDLFLKSLGLVAETENADVQKH